MKGVMIWDVGVRGSLTSSGSVDGVSTAASGDCCNERHPA